MQPKVASTLGVALLSAAVGTASAAFVTEVPGGSEFTIPSGGSVLWSQLDDPSGYVFTDQAFEAVYAAYDSEGADDFTVTHPSGWFLETLATPGLQLVSGTPAFVNHYFYADAGGVPGAVVPGCAFPANTNFVHDAGDLLVDVSGCLVMPPVAWVSQQVRQDYVPFGQHHWATRASSNGNPAVWRNPGNGFQTGCVAWSPANAACGMNGTDFLFELVGNPSTCICPPVPGLGPLGSVLTALALAAAAAHVLRRPRG